jgi:type I restriction-modification system DNA methylase subunit
MDHPWGFLGIAQGMWLPDDGSVESEGPNPIWFFLYCLLLPIAPLAQAISGDTQNALTRFLNLTIMPLGFILFGCAILNDYWLALAKPATLCIAGSSRFFPYTMLGWDVDGNKIIDEVKGQKIAGGQKRVDYSFNMNNQPVMFLEAKQLSANLYEPEYAKQAISYGYNKDVTWVILSDFEGIKVFNALRKTKSIQERTVIDLKYTDYLEKFEILWLLSKASAADSKLNEYARKIGHVENRVAINDLILAKMLEWRDKLIKQISSDNKHLTAEEVHECVQKLLNRLLFIRTCEDRGLEEKGLLNNTLKDWKKDNTKFLYKMLIPIFRDFDDKYNSNLFAKHELENIKISDDTLSDIIPSLYEDKKEDETFDFAVIDADILGKMYEQYLGAIQKGENLAGKEKRKSHGIYYTPKYIVDYIIKNTLGKILDDLIKQKKYDEIGKIKVLDPACGSGSFLIRALQEFDKAYGKTPDNKDDETWRRIKALSNNIYGVDLDDEAVELAKLNLLLSAVGVRMKLPDLSRHIECGNSLIDDPKIAGDNAFKWGIRFKDVMDKGGFDVIIGNPPYGATFNHYDKEYFDNNYHFNKSIYDSYRMFVELAIKLLKPGGVVGLIIPSTWFYLVNAINFRKNIVENYSIRNLINLPQTVFQDAAIDTCVIIIEKKPPKENEVLISSFQYKDIIRSMDNIQYNKIAQGKLLKGNDLSINLKVEREDEKLLFKIKKQPKVLDDFAEIITGIKPYQIGKGVPKQTKKILLERPFTAEKQKNRTYKPYLTGKYIGRYISYPNKEYLSYGKWLAEPKTEDIFENKRIILQQIRNPSLPRRLIATIINKGIYTNNGLHNLLLKDGEADLEWVLAILNSKLMNYYFSCHFNDVNIKPSNLYKLPYPAYTKNLTLRKLVSSILLLNQRYAKIMDKQTSETEQMKRQIEETDRDIDELVYKLYGLTKEEIAVVEGEK